MQLHANAKLGLAGRYQLVLAIESGLPGHGAPLVAPLAGSRRAHEAGAR